MYWKKRNFLVVDAVVVDKVVVVFVVAAVVAVAAVKVDFLYFLYDRHLFRIFSQFFWNSALLVVVFIP